MEKLSWYRGRFSGIEDVLCNELQEKLAGGVPEQLQYILLVYIVLTNSLTARYFCRSFPSSRMFPPLFCAFHILVPTQMSTLWNRAHFLHWLGKPHSICIPPFQILFILLPLFPNLKWHMLPVWESKGVLKAMYPVSFNRFPA